MRITAFFNLHFIVYVYMCAPVCVCIPQVCMNRSEKGIRSPRIGAIGVVGPENQI